MNYEPHNKYHRARKVDRTRGDRTYDSKAEMLYREYLNQLEAAGVVSQIKEQPRVQLVGDIFYKPDFRYMDDSGAIIYVEIKGVMTDRFRIMKKLWRFFGPGRLDVVRRDGSRFITIDRVIPDITAPDGAGGV